MKITLPWMSRADKRRWRSATGLVVGCECD